MIDTTYAKVIENMQEINNFLVKTFVNCLVEFVNEKPDDICGFLMTLSPANNKFFGEKSLGLSQFINKIDGISRGVSIISSEDEQVDKWARSDFVLLMSETKIILTNSLKTELTDYIVKNFFIIINKLNDTKCHEFQNGYFPKKILQVAILCEKTDCILNTFKETFANNNPEKINVEIPST